MRRKTGWPLTMASALTACTFKPRTTSQRKPGVAGSGKADKAVTCETGGRSRLAMSGADGGLASNAIAPSWESQSMILPVTTSSRPARAWVGCALQLPSG